MMNLDSLCDDIVRLNDEERLSNEELQKRLRLGRVIVAKLPRDVLGNLSVWQPEVGCLNRCLFCSQEAGIHLRMLDGVSVRTLAGAFRFAMKTLDIPFLSCWKKYKPGIVFPYLDNDIGSYPYLLDYIAAVDSLGGKVRLSTIGWSRKNILLNNMHRTILQKYTHALAGVRFSLSSYSYAWHKNYDEFILDFINSIKTYRTLLKLKDQEGHSGACIDIDFKPDIIPCSPRLLRIGDYHVVEADSYYMVLPAFSEKDNVFKEAWLLIGVENAVTAVGQIEKLRNGSVYGCTFHVIHGHADFLLNEDGLYYGFYPDLSRHVTDGIFFFPGNAKRQGGLLNACWPLREMEDFVCAEGVTLPAFPKALETCHAFIEDANYSPRRKKYLLESFLPMFSAICRVLDELELSPDMLFDPLLVRDRGVIRNSGRAYFEFRRIASGPNIMVVPDPLLCSEHPDQVWRMFPASISTTLPDTGSMGRKSVVVNSLDTLDIDKFEDHLCLVAWAVDAPSHSHVHRDGSVREEYVIPIDDFTAPLLVYDIVAGKEAGLLPGR